MPSSELMSKFELEFLPNREIYLREKIKDLYFRLAKLKGSEVSIKKPKENPFSKLHINTRKFVFRIISESARNNSEKIDASDLKSIHTNLFKLANALNEIDSELPELIEEMLRLLDELVALNKIRLKKLNFTEKQVQKLMSLFRGITFTLCDELERHAEIYSLINEERLSIYETLMSGDLVRLRAARNRYYEELRKKAQDTDPS